MPDYSWPPSEQRRVMGKRLTRLDGPVKASGTSQVRLRHQAAGPALRRSADLLRTRTRASRASTRRRRQSLKGVTAVRVISPAGTEIQWAGTEVAAVAAVSHGDRARCGAHDQGRVRGAAPPGARRGSRPKPAAGPSPRGKSWWAIPTRRSRKRK